MKSSMLQRIGWVLVVFSTPLSIQAQTRPIKNDPTSTISGKVTIKGKGVSGIIVGLRPADPYSRQTIAKKGTTDSEGNYRITNVPPGSYQVLAAAPAFVSSGDPSGRTLIIAAGETVEGIDFSLNRGGVITGKVTDSDGRPLIEEQITLMAVEGGGQGGQYFYQQLNAQTDDRGIYRIFGIPQGRYKVALGQSGDGSHVRGPRTSQYQQTFHPAEIEPSKATVIEVSEGSEATNVDITVGRTLATFTASGRIVHGETGQPLPNIKYGVQTLGDNRSSFVSSMMTSDSRGEFKVENLTPGKYAIFIVPQANDEMSADPLPFDLLDQNVSGLLLKTSPAASLSGVVLLEGTNDRSVIARLNQMRIQVYVAKESAGPSWIPPVIVSQDGSFRMGGLRSGVARFSLTSSDGRQLRGFTITRVERDGVAQPNGIEIKDGDQITGVRLIVGFGNGTIRGQIKLETGELPATARFSVWLTQVGNPASSQNVPSPNVDSRGRFVIEGLPAGNYEVNAAVYIPDSRNPPPRGKQQVNVADGTVTEVTITIEPNPNRGPANP